jgi:type IV secretory pathway TrbD component
MGSEQRIAALAALALLVTMFFPWYGLQSLNRKTGAIYSHSINAFGDVSFVEAAIFLVAAGVVAMTVARVEGRDFHLPGGDGTIVLLAGSWAGLLIFYRVFDRPAGDGYPVGIEWGFFLAFVAAGSLAYAGWRMRGAERPEPPLRRGRPSPTSPDGEADPTVASPLGAPAPAATRPRRSAPVPARERAGGRAPYPPAPAEQLSFEDPPDRSQ